MPDPESQPTSISLADQAESLSHTIPTASEDPVSGGLMTQSTPVSGQLQAAAPTPSSTGGLSGLQGAAQAPLHTRIADGIMSAFSKSDGSAGGFLRSVLAGGLAGASAAARAPRQPGGGVAAGLAVGGEAGFDSVQKQRDIVNQQKQQNIENQNKQQQLDLQKQKALQEKTSGDHEYDLRLREDARQQATSIRSAADFEKRSTLIDQEIANGNFESVKKNADYLQSQSDQWNDLQAHGGERLKVNGAESPEFDHLGDAEDYAMKNQDAVIHGQFKTRLMRNPDSGKWAIMETPYEAPKWHEITDAAGKQQKIFTDTQGALAAQKEVAETKHYQNIAGKSSLDLKKDLEDYKEEGSVRGARKELDGLGNGEDGLPQYSKLKPGSRSALLKDSNERFLKSQTALSKELQKPEDLRDADTVKYLTDIRNSTANEIAGLTKPAWAAKPNPAPNAANPNTPPAAQAPPRPANVPQDYDYVEKGPGGVAGWSKRKPAAPAAQPEGTWNGPEA